MHLMRCSVCGRLPEVTKGNRGFWYVTCSSSCHNKVYGYGEMNVVEKWNEIQYEDLKHQFKEFKKHQTYYKRKGK